MTILFANPWALAGAWAAPVFLLAWLAVRRKSRRAWAAHLSPELGRKLLPPESPRRSGLQAVLVAAGLLLALLAAARPQWGMREERVRPRGRDLMIALDVSRSMLAQDAHPNRLQRAKADILDLLRALQGDRAGLIAFRGKAVQVCPLTSDYAFLEQALQELSPDSAPRGATDVGDALDKALAACESDETAHQAVILISDGEDLAGRALEAADRAAARGIVVFTVGLGDAAGARIPSGAAGEFLTYQGQAVISKLQHETLQAIAERTGGVYVPVGTANVKLDRLYSGHLSKLAAREREERC